MAARLKQLANDACDIIGGRRMHPTRTVVGGFTMLPEKRDLEKLKGRLEAAMEDLTATAEIFRSFNVPDFVRETEFVSLKGEEDYPFISGGLVSTDGVQMKEHEYLKMTNEYCVPRSTAKWARLSRESFAVGALARLNNNYEFLQPKARELSESFGLKPVNHNPFMNNIAQLVECVHVTLDSIDMINGLLDSEWDEPRQPVQPGTGTGVGAVEVPRGILYHCYEFDGNGRIVKSDCVIPTGQNHANIHLDLKELASQYAATGKRDYEIKLLAEMLVRSYDPCISCSVH
jgi:coenzyme F420-reducing hydrogenase alpha subunit